jgi:hypothetical protein
MRGVHENRLTCLCVDPPGLRPTGGEHQRMNFPLFDHAELHIAIERCSFYRLPTGHHPISISSNRGQYIAICQDIAVNASSIPSRS